MQKSIILFICIILVSCSSEEKELQSIKNELRSINKELNHIRQKLDDNKNEDVSNSETDVILDEKETIIYSKIIKKLPTDSIYVLYNSDFEGPDETRQMDFEYETVYFLPIENYSYKNHSKGRRISEIGFNRSPVWNKKGNKIAYLNFIKENKSSRFPKKGTLVIKDVLKGDTKIFDNINARLNDISWDESGNIIAFAQENSICIFNIKKEENYILYKTDSRPEAISISPDGNFIMYMTRDNRDTNDGWRPNLLNVETKEMVKIGKIDDGITTYNPYLWHKNSSKVIFRGNLIGEKHLGEYWEYDLETKKLEAYIGQLDGFHDQRIRYWDASKLEINRKYLNN